MNIPKIVRIDIVDSDTSLSERLQDTFYLVDPDEKQLAIFKEMVETRNEEDDDGELGLFYGDYFKMLEWLNAHFEVLDIERREIQW